MALRSLVGVHPGDLNDVLKELQRIRFTRVSGAAAGTLRTNKMAIAAMRAEDTIVGVHTFNDAAAAVSVDDTANAGISDIRAQGTHTNAGNPADAQTSTVNGKVYTWKTTPTLLEHVKIVIGDNTAMAVNLRNAINAWENRRLTNDWNKPQVVATASAGVVTITAILEGAAGNSFTLATTATGASVSGANLSGGSDTGGFFSTTNNTTRSVHILWFDKQ